MEKFKRLLKEIRDFVRKFVHGTSYLVVYENEKKHCYIEAHFPETDSSARKKIRYYFRKISKAIERGEMEDLIDEHYLVFRTTEPDSPHMKKNFEAILTLKISIPENFPMLFFREICKLPIKIIRKAHFIKDLNLD